MIKSLNVVTQGLFWVGLWVFWFVVSRQNHPAIGLNIMATTCLVATFALAFNLNERFLIPRVLAKRQFGLYALGLAGVQMVLALVCTGVIHLGYDLVIGPDPRRFGFVLNLAIEFALISFHVAVGRVIVWLLSQRQRSRQRFSVEPEA